MTEHVEENDQSEDHQEKYNELKLKYEQWGQDMVMGI